MDDITLARVVDPGRGQFCALNKQGVPRNLPPVTREPLVRRETNPRGVRRPFKTLQDSLPKEQRQRYKDWLKRLEAMQK